METQELIDLIHRVTSYPYMKDTLQLFIGGSAAHGASLDGKSDLDVLGVYVPPIEEVIGIRSEVEEHYVWSTAGDKTRNTPDDIDMNMYSIRKWAKMAMSGNPSALEFMFVPNLGPRAAIWDKYVTQQTRIYLSSHAGFHFLKFCEHMLRTLKGEGQGKRGKRLDLIGTYGYDTKAAMHLMRVLGEGIELMETGKITLPRPNKQELIDIRVGKAGTLKDIEALAAPLFKRLEESIPASALPERVDERQVSEIVVQLQQEVWRDADEWLLLTTKAFNFAVWTIAEMEKLHPTVWTEWQNQDHVRRHMLEFAVMLHEQDKKKAAGGS